eukprot:gnl/Spiro4/7318_TR3832_c0_g1_i1.p1 gnl/Spiro4/7318_TR3832_c0_g1~~gnl/Spiro4/7318_TR3832_c0_g1_i1.p1  ORF type:complete len:225 (+),score=28.73 gnl/Spiro4/7318_TR3832_c0_g1_i1:476-1150(+)
MPGIPTINYGDVAIANVDQFFPFTRGTEWLLSDPLIPNATNALSCIYGRTTRVEGGGCLFPSLPRELVDYILSFVNLSSLRKLALVSRAARRVVTQSGRWLHACRARKWTDVAARAICAVAAQVSHAERPVELEGALATLSAKSDVSPWFFAFHAVRHFPRHVRNRVRCQDILAQLAALVRAVSQLPEAQSCPQLGAVAQLVPVIPEMLIEMNERASAQAKKSV